MSEPAGTSPETEKDYSHKWQVMTAVGVAVFLGTVDGSIVNIALPTIVDDFDTSFGAVQWVPLSYLLTQATLVLGMGRLGDIAGRKAMFVAGFAVFTLGSVLSGISPGVEWLILFRVVQGIGSALIFSMQFALITESFPPSERGKALGINGTIVSTGIISGGVGSSTSTFPSGSSGSSPLCATSRTRSRAGEGASTSREACCSSSAS
jgi:MFS family permease